MKFTLEIDLESDAMCRPMDSGAALERIADTLGSHSFTVRWDETDAFDRKGGIKDDDGNTVGKWEVVA